MSKYDTKKSLDILSPGGNQSVPPEELRKENEDLLRAFLSKLVEAKYTAKENDMFGAFGVTVSNGSRILRLFQDSAGRLGIYDDNNRALTPRSLQGIHYDSNKKQLLGAKGEEPLDVLAEAVRALLR